MAVPNIFGTATSAIPLSQLDTNFATPVTIGNTAVQLGNTVTSFGNVTLTNVTISSGNVTITGANVSGTANVSTLIVTGNQTSLGNVTVTGNVSANIVTVSAGSDTAPSITTTGDTNTGIFFPAADAVATTVAGTQGMRLTTTGLGVGTSSPDSRLTIQSGGDTELSFKDSGGTTRAYVGTAGAFGSAPTGALRLRSDQGGIVFGFAGSEQMRIDTSGNLTIGGTTSVSRITSYGTTAYSGYASAIGAWASANYNTASSGQLLGILSQFTGYAPNNTSSYFYYGLDTVTLRFGVQSNGGIANYSANNVNLSDRREKTNFAPAGDYLAKICAIPVQTFNYIDQNFEEDDGLTLGVVAQDVQAVAPELVIESNWGTIEEPRMRLSIYQTDLQYALMKCIQEQQALIQSLTTRITALENK